MATAESEMLVSSVQEQQSSLKSTAIENRDENMLQQEQRVPDASDPYHPKESDEHRNAEDVLNRWQVDSKHHTEIRLDPFHFRVSES